MNRGTGLQGAEIRATADGVSASVSISIRPVEAGAIILETDSVRVTSGESRALTARVVDASGVDLPGRSITWVSRDREIVQIDAQGLAQAGLYLTPEVREVVVVAQSEGQVDSLVVLVHPRPVARLVLPDSLLVLAESDRMGIRVRAYDASNRELADRAVEWTTEDATIVRMISPDTLEATPYEGDGIRQTRLMARISEGQQAAGGEPIETFMNVRVFVDYERASTFFELVPEAFPDLQEYVDWFGPGWDPIHSGAVSMTNAVRLDLNQDGHMDLLVHMWQPVGQRLPGIDVLDAVPNRLVAFLNDGSGKFRDGTFELFGREIVDMGQAMSRNHVVGDFNGDGIPDVAFALNREDGRGCFNGDERGCIAWKAVGHVVLSQGRGRYALVPFGEPAWHHAIGVARRGGRDVILTQWDHFEYVGGSFREVRDFPLMGSADIFAYSLAPDGDSDYLITDWNPESPPTQGLQVLARRGGGWAQIGTWAFPKARPLWVEWGSLGGAHPWTSELLIEHLGAEFIWGGFTQICSIARVPGQAPTVLAKFSAARLNRPTMGADSIPHPETTSVAMMLAFQVGSSLVELQGLFGTEAIVELNSNFTDCRDLDGDGFPDVVHYGYAQPWLGLSGKPVIYLNDGAGSFLRIPENRIPDAPYMGPQWSQVLLDVNGDGLDDIFIFPGNGCVGSQGCAFALYRGRRPLR